MSKTYYQIFDISPAATNKEIEKAFKKLSKIYHPDKNPEKKEWATRNFQKISNMKDILLNKEERKKYDEKIRAEETQERLRKEEEGKKKREEEEKKRNEEEQENEYSEIFNDLLNTLKDKQKPKDIRVGVLIILIVATFIDAWTKANEPKK